MTFAQILMVYNQAESIGAALDSVLLQYPMADEVIVGDDGSTDESLEIVRNYEHKHRGLIRIVTSDKNQGPAANLNRCIDAATSDYVSCLAADDVILPGKNAAQFPNVAEYGGQYGIFYSDYELHDFVRRVRPTRRRSNRGKEGYVFEDVIRRRFHLRNFWIPKRLWAEIGGYDESLRLYEDWKFKLEATRRAKVKYCGGTYARYLRHSSGVSRAPAAQHYKYVRKICDELGRCGGLTPRQRRLLGATASHFQMRGAGSMGAKLRFALTSTMQDPWWVRRNIVHLLAAALGRI